MSRSPGLVLGCSALGRSQISDEAALATIEAALEEGISAFDTAPHYGAGRSERRLGVALRGLKDVSISTKVGRRIVGDRTVHDHTAYGAWKSLEGSLARLNRDRVDVLHAHDPIDVEESLSGEFRALVQMRREGTAAAIGCGMNVTTPLDRIVREVDLDCAMVAGHLNLLDRDALRKLLPVARETDTDVWVAGVLATGVIANPVPGSTYRYGEADPGVLARLRRLAEVVQSFGVALLDVALHLPMRYPGVSRVVVGATQPEEVRQLAASWRTVIPEGVWTAVGVVEDSTTIGHS